MMKKGTLDQRHALIKALMRLCDTGTDGRSAHDKGFTIGDRDSRTSDACIAMGVQK
jgi:hypothetical protein